MHGKEFILCPIYIQLAKDEDISKELEKIYKDFEQENNLLTWEYTKNRYGIITQIKSHN